MRLQYAIHPGEYVKELLQIEAHRGKPQALVEAVNEHRPDIFGMSALLTTTMAKMVETIRALVRAGPRDKIKVMVGGAPVTGDFPDQIRADGYGSSAAAAVEKAKAFVKR